MEQQWSYNAVIGIELGDLADRLLAIVGPSGSGKTTLAARLQRDWPQVAMVPRIYTTRQRRKDDTHGHYCYLSDGEFDEIESSGEFFICRKAPPPRYGWMGKDLANVVHNGQIAILPFRHGGAKFLLDVVPRMMIVFIEPTVKASFLYSADRVRTEKEQDATSVILDNKALLRDATARGWPTKIVRNDFAGLAEFEVQADSIIEWAQEVRVSTREK